MGGAAQNDFGPGLQPAPALILLYYCVTVCNPYYMCVYVCVCMCVTRIMYMWVVAIRVHVGMIMISSTSHLETGCINMATIDTVHV